MPLMGPPGSKYVEGCGIRRLGCGAGWDFKS